MVIVFQKGKRRIKYLLITLLGVAILALFIFSIEFFIRRNVFIFEESFVTKKAEIVIDFETLEKVKEMKSFEKIEPFSGISGRRGRGNPFILYGSEDETENDFLNILDIEEDITQ